MLTVKGLREWRVYIVETSSHKLYTGISINVQHRVKRHNEGKGAKCLLGQLPVCLVWSSKPMCHTDALRLEMQIKEMRADEKRRMVNGEAPVPYEK